MAKTQEKDYVLGTHDEEVERLGLQHRVWRPQVLECWQRAGITEGMKVADIGCGPGYATVDLAEIVGPQGHVTAIERSQRFASVAQGAVAARGLRNVTIREADLMEQSIGKKNLDAAWCRWVACFVSSPEKLVQQIADSLRVGGVAVFHEYSHYESWQLLPQRPVFESFVDEIVASWRANGGEPNIALQLPTLLHKAGFKLRYAKPLVYTITPQDYMWQWPSRFVKINTERLLELGRVTPEWAKDVQREFAEAETAPETLLTTPVVLEIVAEKI